MIRKAHFKKGVNDEHLDIWFMVTIDEVFGANFKFSKRHNSVKRQLEELGFKSVIISDSDLDVVYFLVGLCFENDADEAEFILKYSDGIEIEL